MDLIASIPSSSGTKSARVEIVTCIFAKPPVAGLVKTRLAQSIGPAAAAQLAAAMLRDVWSVVEGATGVMAVLAAAEPGAFGIDVAEERIWLQGSGDLGARIESILQRALECAPAAIALGADSPLITTGHLKAAMEVLESADAVLGPCDDGGFYLLGLRSCPSGLLDGIAWSTENTLLETEFRLQAHRMKVGRLPNLFDVDTVAELNRLRSELQHLPPEVAPRVRQCLDELAW